MATKTVVICHGRVRLFLDGDWVINGGYRTARDEELKTIWPAGYKKNTLQYERIVTAPEGENYNEVIHDAQILVDRGEL